MVENMDRFEWHKFWRDLVMICLFVTGVFMLIGTFSYSKDLFPGVIFSFSILLIMGIVRKDCWICN